MTVKLNNDGAKKLNQVSMMPQIQNALSGWGLPHTIKKFVQTVTDGDVTETEEITIEFLGAIQPLSVEELKIKPEGQRNWQWLQIHDYYGALNLHVKDKIEYNGENFKVMAVKDYRNNNYMEYHIISEYVEYEG